MPENVPRLMSSLRRNGLIENNGPLRVQRGTGLPLRGVDLPMGMTRSRTTA